jgi:hypothetical protein
VLFRYIPFQVQGDKLVPQLDGGNPNFVIGSDGKYTGGKLQLDGGAATTTKSEYSSLVVMIPFQVQGDKLVPQLDGGNPNFVIGSDGKYTGGKLQLDGGTATTTKSEDSSFVVMVPFQLQGNKLVPVEDSSFVLQGTFELNGGGASRNNPFVVKSPDWSFQLNGGGPDNSTFVVQGALVLTPGEGRSLVTRYQSLRNGRKSGNSQLEAFRKLIVYAPRDEEPVWVAQALEVNWKPSNDSSSNVSLPAQYRVQRWAQSGDCFTTIAAQSWAYGDARKWKIIYEANRDKLPDPNNPNLIRPGTVWDIPSLPGERRSGIREEAVAPIIANGTRG